MTISSLLNLLIIIHAALGGIALLAGAFALLSEKGKKIHVISGKIFFYAMLGSIILSIVIALSPQHENAFLLAVGLFSGYFVLSGKRSLKYKQLQISYKWDFLLAFSIIATGLLMIFYPILLTKKINLVLLIFGLAALFFGFRDYLNLKQPKQLQKKWLKLHLGKMTGAYIAALSAFLVVNNVLPGMWNWFAPSIIGVPFIISWIVKIEKSNKNE